MRSPLRMIFVCAVIAIVAIALPASLPTVQTGAWTPVWNLAEARAGAAAVLLPNGSVLVVGGLVDGQPTNSAEIFNPDGTFTSASAMSVPRAGHSAILLVTGEVLVTGGTTSGGGVTNSSELYDVLSQRWSSAPPMKEARTGHTAVQMLDGSALIIAGNNSHGPVSLVEQYSLVGEDFSSVGTLLHPRIDAAAASLGDGRVLVVGGAAVNADDDSAPTNLAEVFDPGTGASTSASPLAFARSAGTATALLDGRIAVVGGNDGTNDLASSEIYDPTSDSWSTIAGISPRSHHLAVLLPRNHGVLIAGGAPGAATEMLLPWANDNAGAFAALSASAGSHRNGFALAISNEGLLLAAGGDAGTAAEIYRFATLKTDKDDYAPGQTVTVTGTGWQPGEQVTLTLTEVPAIDSHPPITVTADAWGNISDSSFTPDEHDFQVRFFVVATGSQSQAQTSFTDGNVTLAVSGVG
ncbi:MAG TPA: kelch repeat-containing protein, partial [Clostridia bacterium]|nr:kelch repeat-containing protein [Clostridia bacterium]